MFLTVTVAPERAAPLPGLALRDLRSPSTSTISSASAGDRSWSDAHRAAPADDAFPILKRAFLPRDEEPRQRALVKVPSLPVPSSPTDAAPLPHRRNARIPRAQVFLARPSTPRSLAGFAEERARLLDAVRDARLRAPPSPVAPSPVRAPPRRAPSPQRRLGPRCVSDVVRAPPLALDACPPPRSHAPKQLTQTSLRRASSVGDAGRVGTPAPTFWAAAADFECADVCDAPPSPPPMSRAHELHLPEVAVMRRSSSRRHSFSALTAPAESSDAYPSPPPSPGGALLGSLRQLSLRRQRVDPWRVRVQPAQEHERSAIAPRVLSFDAYRTRAQRDIDAPRRNQPRAPRARGRARLVFEDNDCVRLSMCGDEYVGFMGVTPTRGELFKLKSRNFFARLVGRRVQ